MSTTQPLRDPWLDEVRLSPNQWFELVTGRKIVPFRTTPDMPTFQVLTRKEAPMAQGFDVSDPCCPDCKQYPLVQRNSGDDDGGKIFWCGGCGVLVEVTYTGVAVDRVQVNRPTHPGHKPTDML